MIPLIQPVLYIDPQTAVPRCFCVRCGGECYQESELCRDCEEEA